MIQQTRLTRLRQGALSWGLFRDTSLEDRYIEYFLDENWIRHQRRLSFHIGTEPPARGATSANRSGGSASPRTDKQQA
ncbi:MAG: MFS transporter [Rhodocyclaceae bacterium]